MNVYRNKRTGAEVITASAVTGDDWELVKTEKPKQPKQPKKEKTEGGEGE